LCASFSQITNDGWQFHTGAIASLAFTPAGDKLISASIDQSIIVWHDLSNKNKYSQLAFAHIGGVDQVCVLSDSQFVTSGADRTVRTWEIKA
jgi:WD40 repeat protein